MTGAAPITRRRFLRRTLAGAALLALGGTVLRNLGGYELDEAAARRLRLLSPKEALVFAAVARRMLAPDEATAPSSDDLTVVNAVDDYLAALPAHISSDVRALLQLVEHTPVLLSLRASRFTRLDAVAQDAVLEDWATSRFAMRRQGFVALKSLSMIGYYGDPRSNPITGFPGPLLPR